MTLNVKGILLVLLSSLAIGSALAKTYKHHSSHWEKKRSRKRDCCETKDFCRECCDNEVCLCDFQCKPEKLCLSFEACLSFEQTVTVEGSSAVPRPAVEKPGNGKACGKFEICFAEDFSQARYKLFVGGLNTNTNRNEGIVSALLCFGDSRTPSSLKGGGNFPVIARLLNIIGETCSTKDSLCGEGILTNRSLEEFGFGGNQVVIPTLRALYQLIRQGLVFVIIGGGRICDQGGIEYGLDSGGTLRAQLVGKETAGGFLDFDLPD